MAEAVELRFGEHVPVIVIVFEYEREPLVTGTPGFDGAYAIGRWLAGRPEWLEILQSALECASRRG